MNKREAVGRIVHIPSNVVSSKKNLLNILCVTVIAIEYPTRIVTSTSTIIE